MTPESRARRLAQARRLRLLGAALALALCVLVLGTGLFARQMTRSADLVERQLDVSSAGPILNDAYQTLVDAETGQRGFLLTGKERYLGVFHLASTQLPARLRALHELAGRFPEYRALDQQVSRLAQAKLAELTRTVDLYQAGKKADALVIVQTDAGQAYMEELRSLLQAALQHTREQRTDLAHRIIANGESSRSFAIGAVAALVLVAVLGSFQIRQLSRSRARYERDLLKSEMQHRAILEGQREMVCLSDRAGKLLYVNPAYAAHFGRAPQEMVGLNLLDFMMASDRESVKARIDAVFDGGKSRSGENRMQSVGGEPRWVSWTNQLQEGPDGERRLHSVGRDTTVERDLARRLVERERFLNQITDAVSVRIAYIDQDQRVQFANRATLSRYSLPPEQVIGRRRSELIHNAAHDFVTPYLEAALRGRQQHVETPEGEGHSRRIIDLELIPDADPDGNVRGVFAVGVDVTKRKADEQALRDLAEIFEASPDAIVQTDVNGRLTYLNPTARRALGMSRSNAIDGLTHANFHTAETEAIFAKHALPQAQQTGSWVGESSMRVDGKTVPVNHLLIAHRDANGEVLRFSAILRDISEQVAQRRQIAVQTATLSAVIDSMPGLVAVYDREYRYQLVNRSFEAWTGVPRTRCIGLSIGQVFGPDEQERSRPWAARALAGETVSFEKEVPSVQRGRQVNISYLPLRLADGTIHGFIGVGQDVTEQRAHEKRLVTLSERDPLTGLLNRAGLDAHIERCVSDGIQDEIAAIYVDLDRFKPVNDEFGHAVGDEVLRQFADRLRAVVRPTDGTARIGGDEFVVVLAGVRDPQSAAIVADKVKSVARRPFDVAGRYVSISASVGVSHGMADGGWHGLLERADRQMYSVKRAGSDNIQSL